MGNYSTNAFQGGDVLMIHEDDRGNIVEADGLIEMTSGYETAHYLGHFGGNDDDDGTESTFKKQWWGNEGELPERQYRPRLQSMLSGTPLTSASIENIADADQEDLDTTFIDTGFAVSAEVVGIEVVTPKHIVISEEVTFQDGTVVPFKTAVSSEVL